MLGYGPDVFGERPSEIRRRIQPFVEALHAEAPLDELAFSVSAVFDPHLDLIGALAELDQLAGACPTPTRDGVMQWLFGTGMFRGDRSSYHHWRNSCLDEVIATRRGMPITLSVLGIAVGRRLGVRLAPVGMPGHFIVGDPDDPHWFADPFHGRSGLTRDDCRELLALVGVSRWSDRFVEPTPDRLVIARILNNLKVSCERSDDGVRLALVMQTRQAMSEFADEHDAAVRALAPLN